MRYDFDGVARQSSIRKKCQGGEAKRRTLGQGRNIIVDAEPDWWRRSKTSGSSICPTFTRLERWAGKEGNRHDLADETCKIEVAVDNVRTLEYDGDRCF